MSKKEPVGNQLVDVSAVPAQVAEHAAGVLHSAADRPSQQLTLVALVAMVLAGFAILIVYLVVSKALS